MADTPRSIDQKHNISDGWSFTWEDDHYRDRQILILVRYLIHILIFLSSIFFLSSSITKYAQNVLKKTWILAGYKYKHNMLDETNLNMRDFFTTTRLHFSSLFLNSSESEAQQQLYGINCELFIIALTKNTFNEIIFQMTWIHFSITKPTKLNEPMQANLHVYMLFTKLINSNCLSIKNFNCNRSMKGKGEAGSKCRQWCVLIKREVIQKLKKIIQTQGDKSKHHHGNIHAKTTTDKHWLKQWDIYTQRC